jgi:hypothetical protein
MGEPQESKFIISKDFFSLSQDPNLVNNITLLERGNPYSPKSPQNILEVDFH